MASQAFSLGFQKPSHRLRAAGCIWQRPMRKGFDIDPLLVELLQKMPPQSSLDGWPPEQRVRWFRAFVMCVSQIYDTEGEAADLVIHVEAVNEEKAT